MATLFGWVEVCGIPPLNQMRFKDGAPGTCLFPGQCRKNECLRDDQVFVNFHAEARTLRQVEIAFLVDQRGILHD